MTCDDHIYKNSLQLHRIPWYIPFLGHVTFIIFGALHGLCRLQGSEWVPWCPDDGRKRNNNILNINLATALRILIWKRPAQPLNTLTHTTSSAPEWSRMLLGYWLGRLPRQAPQPPFLPRCPHRARQGRRHAATAMRVSSCVPKWENSERKMSQWVQLKHDAKVETNLGSGCLGSPSNRYAVWFWNGSKFCTPSISRCPAATKQAWIQIDDPVLSCHLSSWHSHPAWINVAPGLGCVKTSFQVLHWQLPSTS